MNSTKACTYEELNAVLDLARRPSAQPMAVSDTQLVGLQRRWATALSARLDEAIEFARPKQEADAVARAWRVLASDLDTLRRVLDQNEASSAALAHAMQAEYRMLAIASGLTGLDTPTEESVRLGRSLREAIRAGEDALSHELDQAADTGRVKIRQHRTWRPNFLVSPDLGTGPAQDEGASAHVARV